MSERDIAAKMAQHMATFGNARQAGSEAGGARAKQGLSFLQSGMRTRTDIQPAAVPARSAPAHQPSDWTEQELGRFSSLPSYRAGLLTGAALVLFVAAGIVYGLLVFQAIGFLRDPGTDYRTNNECRRR